MRLFRLLLLASALGALPSASAHAGPLASATLAIQVAGVTATFAGAGATGTATSDTSATLGGGSAFFGSTFLDADGTTFGFPMGKVGVVASCNAAGLFSGATPGKVGGSARFTGVAYLYVTPNAASPFLHLPLDFGKTIEASLMNGVFFTYQSAPWTAGAVTLTSVGPHTNLMTLMATGMNALGPSGVGTLTLVAPEKVWVSVGHTFPVVATLTLTYVPEPATALLFGAGTLALALLGMRRRRG